MKLRMALLALALLALVAGGTWWYLDALVPVPLASNEQRFVPGQPEFGEDEAVVEVLLPAGPTLDAFLVNQSDLALLEKAPEGGWAGQLLAGLEGSRHGRRWRLAVRPGWRLQNGTLLDAAQMAKALAAEAGKLGGTLRVVDGVTLELRFRTRQEGLPALLAQWRVPGSGPFIRQGLTLTRFERFTPGRPGLAGVRISTDPALMESRAWAEGLAARRWAWAVFPGQVAPEDMARVRIAPYDEYRTKDGSVWFLSRRMRRLRPEPSDWARTRLFGVWKSSTELPYDPLGF
ncbi:hypothetical protein [Geothrix oryzisoli]|uniref:hypothetical protein n=1 Tax=Geothrix oryzisoli TaxID=2922721 RepID=UPI001FABC3A9|nr:hypothetical protein [Geothrix oryzisoli]